MLTRELAIAVYENGVVLPDRLCRKSNAEYVEYAERMLDVYRNGAGRTRRSLHQSVGRIFPEQGNCPEKRVRAFCKLLDDASDFMKADRQSIARLRISVFRAAAKHHPLVSQADSLFDGQESVVKRKVAEEHGMDWPQLHDRLFADLIENHTLKVFHGFDEGATLLSRYNVAQTQAVLFDAIETTIRATRDLRRILQFAKLAGLMVRISKMQDHYRFECDGPASVLRKTHRYGVAMARFLPGLLSCRGWSMQATLRGKHYGTPIRFQLDPTCGLVSRVVTSDEFDSSVEARFAKDWCKQLIDGWRIERETEILHRGQTAFFPDFVFVHRDGMRVMLEIVGFWTPEYLQHKAALIQLFRDQPILLAIDRKLQSRLVPVLENQTIYYKDQIMIDDVLAMLKALRSRLSFSHSLYSN